MPTKSELQAENTVLSDRLEAAKGVFAAQEATIASLRKAIADHAASGRKVGGDPERLVSVTCSTRPCQVKSGPIPVASAPGWVCGGAHA